jgi:pimeloyl-ACP methyl ester carboxylesterase
VPEAPRFLSPAAGRGRRQASADLAEAWAEVDGRQVRSFSIGQLRDLPEVVLIPGLGAPGYLYPWMRQLGRWTRATVLDLPGWRRGRGRSSPSTVAAVGAAAARWLEVSGRREVVLAGHSSGAQSALRTALAVPDRLLGVVLAGPTLDPAARHPAVLLVRFLDTILREKLPELPAVLPWYLSSGGLPWLRLVGSVLTDRPEDLLPAIRPPVLVLTGDRDRFAPPSWAERLATMSSAPCFLLPGPHNACFTSPEAADAAVHQAVLGWARTRPADPAPTP